MYHRVLPDIKASSSFSNESIIVSPSTFKFHLEFLKKIGNLVSLTEFNLQLKQNHGFSLKPTFLITFDDGWVDNYEYALPIIKKSNVSATIFLPLNYIGERNLFWQEELSWKLSELSLSNPKSSFLKKLGLDDLSSKNNQEKKKLIHTYVTQLKQSSYDEIDNILSQVQEHYPEKHQAVHVDSYLNWNQVEEMKNNNISFGSHACSHRILTNIELNEVKNELQTSADRIKQLIGETPLCIAYPNGNSNIEIQKIAQNIGYKLGFGTNSGAVEKTGNQFNINRVNMHQQSTSNKPRLMMALLGYF